MRREDWISLDGSWDFSLDPDAICRMPEELDWHSRIVVPFSPETSASGIANTGFYRACWYRRTFAAPALDGGARLLLHFGAVDYHATVWINGQVAGRHEGGYTPFTLDITELVSAAEVETVVVRAEDDPVELSKPRGKQDWQVDPHSIWYPRTTGIWQPVWMERVASTSIGALRWTP